MNLQFLAAATSTVIHYQVTDVDPMIQREGQSFEFQPQQVRILVNGDGFQVQVEGPRKLVRGILSPIQRITEHFHREELRPGNGIPLWILDLAEFWLDALRKNTFHQEVANEIMSRGLTRTGKEF